MGIWRNTMFELTGKRIFVAGHRGMVGSAIVRRLEREDCTVLTVDRSELDLSRAGATREWFDREQPDAVFLAAAKVGGIHANDTNPADFLGRNLAIQNSVIDAAYRSGVAKLVFLGSSCIYPKHAEQPIREDSLLTGPLEPTNEWYAIAKIAGVKLCQAYRRQFGCDFVSAMPTNLYGPGDNYALLSSHVLPALIRKAHEARSKGEEDLEIWGSGEPMREFLHVDDLADALVVVMQAYSDEPPINIGSGHELSIADLARQIMDIAGLGGKLTRDLEKPDGTPRKLLDSSRIRAMGWQPRIDLRSGLESAFADYVAIAKQCDG